MFRYKLKVLELAVEAIPALLQVISYILNVSNLLLVADQNKWILKTCQKFSFSQCFLVVMAQLRNVKNSRSRTKI